MTGQLEVGTRIGDYVISGIVGHGGMATVYAAEPVSGGSPVALKVMASELSHDDAFRRRFLREPGYVGEVAHPNLMPIHDFGESAGALYLAMPLVRGHDLHTLIARESPLGIERALAILAQVAGALDALHGRGVLHRDVKPGNVMVASGEGVHPAEHAYLTDFGLSKSPDRDSTPLTGTGQFVGTADYSAPEQIAGDEVDGRADAYSLACMLVEMLTGQPPFPREGVVETLQAQLGEAPPALDERRSDLPQGVNAVVARGLAKDPGDRFETCMAFVAAVAAAAGLGRTEAAGGPSHGHHDAARMLRLRVTSGGASGAETHVEDGLLIGREAGAVGHLAHDPEMSRRHARIDRTSDGHGWTVADLGSSNGTYVNGRRIEENTPIGPGDTIEVGGTTIVAEATPPAARRVSLHLELDLEAGVARIMLDERGQAVRITRQDATWRFAPGA